jgi:hypothetical protein
VFERGDAAICEEKISPSRKPCLQAKIAAVAHFPSLGVKPYAHFQTYTRENLSILDGISPLHRE